MCAMYIFLQKKTNFPNFPLKYYILIVNLQNYIFFAIFCTLQICHDFITFLSWVTLSGCLKMLATALPSMINEHSCIYTIQASSRKQGQSQLKYLKLCRREERKVLNLEEGRAPSLY